MNTNVMRMFAAPVATLNGSVMGPVEDRAYPAFLSHVRCQEPQQPWQPKQAKPATKRVAWSADGDPRAIQAGRPAGSLGSTVFGRGTLAGPSLPTRGICHLVRERSASEAITRTARLGGLSQVG
jgi:hypothetical protein